ncbi:MAG: rod shape-determining protein MreC [Chloroflexi bacterium]|nr:rod shape-determining protein MreC [Chloroflexota bacterium]
MIGGEPKRRQVPRWVSTVTVLVVAAVLLAPGPWREVEKLSTTVLAPIQMGVSGTLGEVGDVFGTFQRVRDLAGQNTEFRDEIDRLQSELVRMRELEVENRDLRNLLSLKERTGPGTLLPVAVIGRDDSPYVQAVTIDRGQTGGVQKGSIVVTNKGLVGRVESANPASAKVRLITDLNSAVAIRLQTESRTTGVLRGQASGNALIIDFIPQQDQVQTGDMVITSGMGEVFPEGLVVGRVLRTQRKDADPFQMAAVEPAVDMNKLERLYVLVENPDR